MPVRGVRHRPARGAALPDEEGKRVTPQEERIYIVQLCSGERRRWRFLGLDAQGLAWWRDEETGRTFSEASLMYVWEIVAEA